MRTVTRLVVIFAVASACVVAVLICWVLLVFRWTHVDEFVYEETFGEHKIVIVDTSGAPTRGNLSHDYSGDVAVLRYKHGDFEVLLSDDILTVNGQRYALGSQSDSIKIIDGAVQINGKPATPDRKQSHNQRVQPPD